MVVRQRSLWLLVDLVGLGVPVTRTGRDQGSGCSSRRTRKAVSRATTAFKRLLRLEGVNVTDVTFLPALIVVTVALRRRRLVCGHCGHTTRFRYDTRPVRSRWRHLDVGVWRVEVRASLRRLACPTHGVVVEGGVCCVGVSGAPE